MSYKSVKEECQGSKKCQVRVSYKGVKEEVSSISMSVLQECQGRVSSKKCQVSVSYKSVKEKWCPVSVWSQSVLQKSYRRASHKSVK